MSVETRLLHRYLTEGICNHKKLSARGLRKEEDDAKAQRTERRGQPPPLGAPARQLKDHRMQGSSAPQHPGIGKAKKKSVTARSFKSQFSSLALIWKFDLPILWPSACSRRLTYFLLELGLQLHLSSHSVRFIDERHLVVDAVYWCLKDPWHNHLVSVAFSYA